VSARLSRLRAARERLGPGIDALTKELTDLETRLVDLRLGVRASTPLKGGSVLVLDRYANSWGLWVDRVHDKTRCLATIPIRLSSASVGERVDAAHAMPALLREVITNAEALQLKIRRGTAELKRVFGDE
jgi:hypothetical protein